MRPISKAITAELKYKEARLAIWASERPPSKMARENFLSMSTRFATNNARGYHAPNRKGLVGVRLVAVCAGVFPAETKGRVGTLPQY